MTNPVKKTKKNYNLPGPGPGRPKGSKNKFTDLKNAFLEAFEELNGTEGLVKWADKNDRNRAQFYQMITKMLPSNVSLDHTGPLPVILSDKYLPTEANGRDKPESDT